MNHDFSVDTKYVKFCSRCARPDILKTRRAPCVRITDVAEVLKRRLEMLAMLLDAHTRVRTWKPLPKDKPRLSIKGIKPRKKK